jgi:hypothetical protein
VCTEKTALGSPSTCALPLLSCLPAAAVAVAASSNTPAVLVNVCNHLLDLLLLWLKAQRPVGPSQNSKRSVRSTSPLLLCCSSRDRQGCCCRANHSQTICIRLCVAQHVRPAHRMATLSSLASMVPEPSVSNRSKASRISCFCSSVRPVHRNSRGARCERLAACRARKAGHLGLCSPSLLPHRRCVLPSCPSWQQQRSSGSSWRWLVASKQKQGTETEAGAAGRVRVARGLI